MNPFEADGMDLFNSIFATNVQGHIHLVHSLISQLREDQGRVVVIGAPDVPLANYVIKTTLNSALNGFTRALRVDLMGQGISVSLIQPAGTKGGMVTSLPKMIADNRARMSDELKQIYGEPKAVKMSVDNGYDPVWAVDAVDHAVTSAHPKTRYSTTPLGTMIYIMSSIASDWQLSKIIYSKMGPTLPKIKRGAVAPDNFRK